MCSSPDLIDEVVSVPSWFDGFEILLYFFPGFVGGILLRRFQPKYLSSWDTGATLGLKVTLYLILFSMGWRLASDPRITASLGLLGAQALTFAAITAASSIAAVYILYSLFPRASRAEPGLMVPPGIESARSGRALGSSGTAAYLKNLKGPFIMLLAVIAGGITSFLLGIWQADLPGSLQVGDFATWVLKIMLICVGLSMGLSDLAVLRSIRQPLFLLLPVVTALASIGGGFLAAMIWGMSPAQGGALSGGFGWYSLSAVLIADAGHEMLGAAAFLSNLFREAIAILSIGFLQAAGKPLAGISAAGATSMDVCLPPIALHKHGYYTAPSVYHGFVLSLLVPVVVPVFLSML